ncbi:progonadoliberin-2 [Brienomyrus brachyistius]|uniref:progonadoliberin-2 n=1 Tax=Brienomyrus brachyistius TaxID=42636 RepID=UPI0020B2CE54|nr:progonadoliberin-2 [Brienomyrus brachyistius]
MVCVGKLTLLLGMLLCFGAHLCHSQHWSHGWYPGGKRELDALTTAEISEKIKLCEGRECSYVRPQRKNTLKNILVDGLAREFQQKRE